jgi:flagellar basal-body rod modification protein FlgD
MTVSNRSKYYSRSDVMPVESVGGVVQGTGAATERLGLSQEDFLQVLLAQLTFQDPLDPLDNKDFMAQLAQFTSLEQDRQANEKLDTLLFFESAGQAIALLGRTVQVQTDTGGEVVAQVVSTSFRDGAPALVVRTTAGEFLTDIGLAQISVIR